MPIFCYKCANLPEFETFQTMKTFKFQTTITFNLSNPVFQGVATGTLQKHMN